MRRELELDLELPRITDARHRFGVVGAVEPPGTGPKSAFRAYNRVFVSRLFTGLPPSP